MIKDYFIQGTTYRDTGKYKTCSEDEFGSSFFSGVKSITNQGGIRRKYFENFMPLTTSGLKIPSFIILVTAWDNVPIGRDVEKPWQDKLNFPNLIYYGDNKNSKKELSPSIYSKEGCRNLLAAKEISDRPEENQKLIPPILYFTKRKTGYMTFEGMFQIESLSIYDMGRGCENVKLNLLCTSKLINLDELRKRSLANNYESLPKIDQYQS
jgi:hypothetical protein